MRHLPYSKFDRRKKRYPCSFENCEQIFDDPGKLLEHEDKHETGETSNSPSTKPTSSKPIVRSKGIPYADVEETDDLGEVELPEDND